MKDDIALLKEVSAINPFTVTDPTNGLEIQKISW